MTLLIRAALAAASLAGLVAVGAVVLDLRANETASVDTPAQAADWWRSQPLSLRPLSRELIDQIESASAVDAAALSDEALSETERTVLQQQLIAEQKASYEATLPLADLLLKRNQRHEMSRLVKAQTKLLNDDIEGFVADYVRLFELNRDNRTELATSLAAQSRDIRVFRAVGPYLTDAPDWGRTYVETVRRDRIQPAFRLTDYYQYYPDKQRVLFESLIEQGALDQAYLAFFQYLGDDATEFLSIPYDPEFLGYPGAAPFNWLYPRETAARRPNGGVEVVYNRERNVLLSQIFPLSPGLYDFGSEMTGAASTTRGYFAWEVLCLPTGRSLVRSNIENLGTRASTQAFEVEIPAQGCSYQVLRLVGIPGSFPRSVYAEISSVSIKRRPVAEAVVE